MLAGSTRAWLAPTLTLTALWAACTVALVGLIMATGWSLPSFVTRIAPFLLAGYLTARLSSVAGRPPKIIAAAVLAVIATLSWTLFTLAAGDLDGRQAVRLAIVSLPVMLLASAWAYLGMFLGQRPDSTSVITDGPGHDLDELERELRSEIASEETKAPPRDYSASGASGR